MTARFVKLYDAFPDQQGIPCKVAELIKATFAHLGKPRMVNAAKLIVTLPALKVLAHKDRVLREAGCQTSGGMDWLCIAASYDLAQISTESPSAMVVSCLAQRQLGIEDTVRLMESHFWKTIGSDLDPQQCDLVVLEEWFLAETIQHDIVTGRCLGVLDSTFAFQKRRE